MIDDLVQVALLIASLAVFFRYARQTEDNLWLIFTAFAFAAMLLSDLYYTAHTILREGMRVPFAANDIADFGAFLLMSVALSAAVGTERGKWRAVTAAGVVFALANIALWIGWSGEWVRDLFGGVPFGAFICVCFRSLYQTKALRRGERIALWTVCTLLIALQTATFFVWKTQLDMAAYLLMAAAELLLLVRTGLALRPGRSAAAAMSLSFTGYLMICVFMYMSDGIPYAIFSNLATLHLLLILLAARKKVRRT